MADVVLHLALSEELVTSSATSRTANLRPEGEGQDLDTIMDAMVSAERAGPQAAFDRWRRARREALALLREADGDRLIAWATNPLKPATLATTRLAEHWAHGLDITTPLGIGFEDTDRLRHVAWLGHRSLPYAFALAGREPPEVRCELSGPTGDPWEFGPPGAESRVAGPAGDFCRVGARRLDPARSRLLAEGPHAQVALELLRNYAA